MQRSLLAAFPCLLLMASSFAGDVTRLVPADAYGYVVISDAGGLDAKLQTLAQRMKLPIPSFVAMLAARPEITAAINLDGSVAMVALPSEKGTSPVLFIPIKSYDQFVDQLEDATVKDGVTQGRFQGTEFVVGNKGDHAVVAWADHRAAVQHALAYEPETDHEIRQPDGEYDIAGVLASSGIKLLTELAQQGLGEATRVLKQQGGEDNPELSGLQMYDHMFTLARDELSAVTVSYQFAEDSSLRVSKSIWAKPGGKLALMLKNIPVPEQDLMAGLPNVPFVMAVGGVMPEGSFQQMVDFSKLMMGSMQQVYKLEPEQIDAMMDLSMKYFNDMKGMSFLFGVGERDDPLYGEALAAIHVADADRYLDNYLKYWDELTEVIKDAEESFIGDASLEEMALSGNRVLKMKMPIPNMKDIGAENQADAEALMNKLFGSADVTMYMAAVDDHTVLMAYTSPDMLQRAWDAGDNPSESLSRNFGVKATTQQLPEDPLVIGYWSPGGTVAFANRMLGMMPATGGMQIPEFPDTSPIGWTMHVKPEKVEFHGIVPIDTLEGVGEFVNAMMMRGKQVAN